MVHRQRLRAVRDGGNDCVQKPVPVVLNSNKTAPVSMKVGMYHESPLGRILYTTCIFKGSSS